MKILLADDSVTAQQMGKKILSEAGHEVIAVSNGAAALRKVTEVRPDLVILDIYMPGYSGLEVCQRMKEMRDYAHIPVLLTVGKLEPFRKEDAKKVRAEALIIKPFEASELIAAIEKAGKEIGASEVVETPRHRKTEKAKTEKPKTAKVERDWDAEAAEQEAVERAGVLKSAMWKVADTLAQPVSEFEVVAEPKVQDKVQDEDATPESANDAVAETSWSESPKAESAPAKAAAAAAGAGFEADYGGYGVPETESPAGPSISGSVEAQTQQTNAFPPFSVGDSSEFNDVAPQKSSSSEREPEPAPQEPSSAETTASPTDLDARSGPPAIDPAFDPDRTRWASEYATRFIDVPSPTHAGNKPDDEVRSDTAHRDVQPASESSSVDSAPEYADADWKKGGENAPEESTDSWAAEDVEVAADEAEVSLVQEMQQKAAPGTHDAPEHGTANAVASDNASITDIPEVPATHSEETSDVLQSLHSPFSASGETAGPRETADTWAKLASETGAFRSPQKLDASHELGSEHSADEAPSSSSPFSAWPWGTSHAAPESKSPHEDAEAGNQDFNADAQLPSPGSVLDSAADKVRKATDDALRASGIELQPPNTDADGPQSVGTGAIEDMVNRVFEQLKPKLVAEITRGLSADQKNKK